MKQYIFLGALLISGVAFSQVGIDTDQPKATLDIKASPTNANKTDGLIAPRLTGNELKGNDGKYGADQTGAIVYATAAASPTTGKTKNVTEAGYFYFDGTIWQKFAYGTGTAGTYQEPWNVSGTTTPATLNNQDIYQSGNVGIGTTTPSQKLHIETGGTAASPVTGFRLEDGNQKTNFVLTSDTDGVGTWKPVAATRIVGTIGAGIDVPFITTGAVYRKTGSYIDLPSGKWEVRVTMLMPVGGVPSDALPGGGKMTTNDWVWLKTTFSTVNAATIVDSQISSDIEGASLVSNLFFGPKLVPDEPKFNMLNGSVIINNTTTATKRYYYYAGNTDSQEYATGSGKATKFYLFGGWNWGENSITAMKVN